MDLKKTLEDHKLLVLPEYATYKTYEQSEWVCYMFGSWGVNSLCWRPAKGDQPNWFWRKMQYLLVGNRWVKECE
jgi:hypothetical protein